MGLLGGGGADFHLSYFHSPCELPLTLHNLASTTCLGHGAYIVPPIGFDVNTSMEHTGI